MSGTCKDCKWWAPNYSGKDAPMDGPFACRHPKLDHPDSELWDWCNPQDMAAADDGPAMILTGPDFGCIHFEAKQ